MTSAEKLEKLRAAYDSPCRAVIDAFHDDETAQNNFVWCSQFLRNADSYRHADLIDRIYDRTFTYTLLGN